MLDREVNSVLLYDDTELGVEHTPDLCSSQPLLCLQMTVSSCALCLYLKARGWQTFFSKFQAQVVQVFYCFCFLFLLFLTLNFFILFLVLLICTNFQ